MKSVDELAREVIERVRVIDPLLKWCTPETVASIAGIAFAVLTEETERNRVEREQREVKRTGMTPREEYRAETGEDHEDYVEACAPTERYAEWLENELVKAREERDASNKRAMICREIVRHSPDAMELVRKLKKELEDGP
jgi:hypothetical protein